MEHGVKVVTDMGAANPRTAGELVLRIAREMGLNNLSVAVVTGDDILEPVMRGDLKIDGLEHIPKDAQGKMISANVYLGSDPIVEALEEGADVVITGRVSDPALFIGPLRYEFGWRLDDMDKIGRAVMFGHLMECGPHISGGYFADPGFKDVPDLHRLGYPILEAYEDGSAYITKVVGSGGIVNTDILKEQLLYEVGDPANLISPDGVADLMDVRFKQVGPDRVQIFGAKGKPQPVKLKVILCAAEGYIGEGEISYGGPGAYERAKLAAEIVEKRLKIIGSDLSETRVDFIGVNSLYGEAAPAPSVPPNEVRLRVAGRSQNRSHAESIGLEVESLLLNGPAGGGGTRKYVHEITPMYTGFVDRDLIHPRVELFSGAK